MRVALLALCLLLAAASAAADPPICRSFDRQIAHYQTLRGRAHAADSDLWEARLKTHVARLSRQRLSAGCPDRSGAAEAARQLKALLELAAQGALTFFTMGAM